MTSATKIAPARFRTAPTRALMFSGLVSARQTSVMIWTIAGSRIGRISLNRFTMSTVSCMIELMKFVILSSAVSHSSRDMTSVKTPSIINGSAWKSAVKMP